MTVRINITRRRLLRHSALLPLVSLPLLHGCAGKRAECVDPHLLSRGEEQMRKTRQYVDTSGVAGEHCANCEFFSADDGGDCGYCEILDGPVSRDGHCTSWAEV